MYTEFGLLAVGDNFTFSGVCFTKEAKDFARLACGNLIHRFDEKQKVFVFPKEQNILEVQPICGNCWWWCGGICVNCDSPSDCRVKTKEQFCDGGGLGAEKDERGCAFRSNIAKPILIPMVPKDGK